MTKVDDPRAVLRTLFDTAVAAADPMERVPTALPDRPEGRVVVVGAGKASARMAEALEAHWGPCDGLIITRYEHERPTKGIEVALAAHPVPDAAGQVATARMLDLLAGCGADDTVVALMSGGGSSLMIAPAGDMTLAEKQQVNATLLASGAPIDQMNIVRKHLSRVKGGQMAAAAYPARMISLMISDVPGDDPAFIASGPTVGDASTPADARAIVARWGMDLPASAMAVLGGETGVVAPGDDRLSRVENTVICAPSQSLEAAAASARALGFGVRMDGDLLEGEARDLGARLAGEAQAVQAQITAPNVMISGGECTVSGRGSGVGGPNAEFCLSAAIALNGAPGIHVIACDTDGVDGAAEVAGALIGPDTLSRAARAGINPAEALTNHDSHRFFAAIDQQVVTGPTLTNVNDFRAFLIEPLAKCED